MKLQIIFAVFFFLTLVHCQCPCSTEKGALVEALNRHRLEASPTNKIAVCIFNSSYLKYLVEFRINLLKKK